MQCTTHAVINDTKATHPRIMDARRYFDREVILALWTVIGVKRDDIFDLWMAGGISNTHLHWNNYRDCCI